LKNTFKILFRYHLKSCESTKKREKINFIKKKNYIKKNKNLKNFEEYLWSSIQETPRKPWPIKREYLSKVSLEKKLKKLKFQKEMNLKLFEIHLSKGRNRYLQNIEKKLKKIEVLES